MHTLRFPSGGNVGSGEQFLGVLPLFLWLYGVFDVERFKLPG